MMMMMVKKRQAEKRLRRRKGKCSIERKYIGDEVSVKGRDGESERDINIYTARQKETDNQTEMDRRSTNTEKTTG